MGQGLLRKYNEKNSKGNRSFCDIQYHVDKDISIETKLRISAHGTLRVLSHARETQAVQDKQKVNSLQNEMLLMDTTHWMATVMT